MTIRLLSECPQYRNMVIDWMNEEFGSDNSRNFFQGIVEHSMVENRLPITFVAEEDGVLLGTAGIWRGDLLSRQELFPWLSALIVNKEYRNDGIGQKLQQYVLKYCKEKDIDEIFLYTDLKGYYEKSGWTQIDTGYEYMGNEVGIYRHEV